MTSPNDLMSEFQKLKAETNKINEDFLDTTSTFGCSSESILLRKVIDELKSMNSKILKLEEKQEKIEKNQETRSNVLQKTVLDELKFVKIELVDIEEKQLGLHRQMRSVDAKVVEVKEKQEALQDDLKIVKHKINIDFPEVHPDDEKPILEAIVGKWKMVAQENCEAYGKNEWFTDDIKVSVDGERVVIEFIQHQKTFDYKIGIHPYEMMTSPNDLMSEFQKLKAETVKINENFLDTTSTFGCSSDSILLRKVLDELKSMNSKIGKIEKKQAKIQDVVTGIQEKQNAHQATLVELKAKQATLQDVLQKTVLNELEAIKSDMSIIKNKINKDAPGMKSVVEEPIVNQNNVPEVHPDDEKPILEAIVGTWKMTSLKINDATPTKKRLNEFLSDDIKLSVNRENISIEYFQHQKTFNYKIEDNPDAKVFIEENHLKIWLRDKELFFLKQDFFIKNGQFHGKYFFPTSNVEHVLVYNRAS